MQRILLVDDEMNYRRSLMIQLELEGYLVTEVESAKQALSYLNQCKTTQVYPELVISDVQMPDMNGDEFALTLRELFPDLAVLMISAFDLPDKISDYPFLRKPFQVSQIMSTFGSP